MAKAFEGLLGNSCELRMLEYLLPLEGMDFNITELGEEVGVSRVTATKIVTKFIEWGILNPTRSVGITTYYTLNHESPIIKSIEQFNNTLIENILGNETLYEIHEYCESRRPQPTVGITVGEIGQLVAQGSGLQLPFVRKPQIPWGGDEAPKNPPIYAGSSAANMHEFKEGSQTQVLEWDI